MSYVVEVCSERGWEQYRVVPDLAEVEKAEQELRRVGWGTASIRHQPNRLKGVKSDG